MKKINVFIAVTLAILMSVGMAFADNDKTEPGSGINPAGWFGRPGFDNGNAWWKGNSENPPQPPGCQGPECYATGNFNIYTKAIGGGIDYDGIIVDGLGAAGGISGAGGLGYGEASGEVSTITVPIYNYQWVGPNWYNYGWVQVGTRTYVGGTAEGSLGVKGGGLTKTEAFTFNDGEFEGVGSTSNNFATTGATLKVGASGIADASGEVFGGMAQGSIDGSVVFTKSGWVSDGVSGGFAGQGAAGVFFGGAATGIAGQSEIKAGIESTGFSQSVSYRSFTELGNGVVQEKIGTSVQASTSVDSFKNVNNQGVAFGNINGGWVAGGAAGALTHQTANGGTATAATFGSYSGSGNLGCNYNGSLNGYAVTSAITQAGYNGSIMTSAASMKVTSSKATE